MSHPDPRNDPDNTYPVRKFGTGKPVHFQSKTGIPKHKLTGNLEHSVKKMLAITPNSGVRAGDETGVRVPGGTGKIHPLQKSLMAGSAKTKALKGKAGEIHKRALDAEAFHKHQNTKSDRSSYSKGMFN